MYACISETGRGFFEGVRTPSDATAHSRDPLHPCNAKEPEPHWQGSGPERINRRATVNRALSWGRGKPSHAQCPSTARMPPTHHVARRTHDPRSIACRCAPRGTPSCSGHGIMPKARQRRGHSTVLCCVCLLIVVIFCEESS